MTEFLLPDLGEGLQEAEVVDWHVGPGDHVVGDQPLVSVETEKAVVEIPSPRSGRVGKLFVKVGDMVPVGGRLMSFDETPAVYPGAVVGELETIDNNKARVSDSDTAPVGTGSVVAATVKAMPAARRLAHEQGIDLTTLEPSGPDGTLTRGDVEKAMRNETGTGDTSESLRGVRRRMARNMGRSGAEIVPATVTDYAEIDSWIADGDVTVRLARAIARGCVAEPALNAWFFADEERRQLHRIVNLGIAVDTGDGLFVPVLRDVASRSDADLRNGVEALKSAVKKRSIPVAEMRGQTITLSNFGMFGGIYANLVVLPPQVAIVGAGRIHRAVVPRGDGVSIATLLPLSLTFDHRVVSGGEAARFLAAVLADLHLDR